MHSVRFVPKLHENLLRYDEVIIELFGEILDPGRYIDRLAHYQLMWIPMEQ